MAKLYVSAGLVEEALFGETKQLIFIKDATFDPVSLTFDFEIEGDDVPKGLTRVHASFTRVLPKLMVTFQEVKDVKATVD